MVIRIDNSQRLIRLTLTFVLACYFYVYVSARTVLTSFQRAETLLHRKKKGKMDKNRPVSNEVPAGPDDPNQAKEPVTEAERLLMQRYLFYDILLQTRFYTAME